MQDVEIIGAMKPGFDEILSDDAVALIAHLHRKFNARRLELLAARVGQQQKFDDGELPVFPPETKSVRDGDWTIVDTPDDMQDRRVEITGPVDRKMVINALNCGASTFMADFEDASTPSWANLIEGQINLRDANSGTIESTDPRSGKEYALNEKHAVLIVRPRGWHLDEAHMSVDGERVSGAIMDFALYLFHNHAALNAAGSGPYYYLPKLEHYLEARLWNDVISEAQSQLGIANGTVKVTVLIETITAAFQMDEILFELKDHIVGLNAGRWDYIFSIIKKFSKRADFLMPDRGQVTMTQPLMRAYCLLLIKTCHRRGAHAMGGMAAQIPIKGDDAANQAAMDKVRSDKLREANDGHDGTWVAHPGMVPIAKEVFDEVMPEANQVKKLLGNIVVTEADLVEVPTGTRTEEQLRMNCRVGVEYIEAWLRGQGCSPLYNLMEDAATAEISRAQIWQQLKLGAELENGGKVTREFFNKIYDEELSGFSGGKFPEAISLFKDMCLSEDFPDFLTLDAYESIVSEGM